MLININFLAENVFIKDLINLVYIIEYKHFGLQNQYQFYFCVERSKKTRVVRKKTIAWVVHTPLFSPNFFPQENPICCPISGRSAVTPIALASASHLLFFIGFSSAFPEWRVTGSFGLWEFQGGDIAVAQWGFFSAFLRHFSFARQLDNPPPLFFSPARFC